MVVYRITNKINCKTYIGQTIDLSKRWSKHCSNKEKSPISLAIQKYGKENFSILELGQYNSEEDLNNAEDYFTEFYNSLSPNGYNRVIGGQKNRLWSKESLLKASKSKLGNKNPLFGKRHSLETKLKMSLAQKGKPKSKNQIEMLRKRSLGKKASEETKKKMSIAAKKAVNSGRFKKKAL